MVKRSTKSDLLQEDEFSYSENPVTNRKVAMAMGGLPRYLHKRIAKLSESNKATIADFILDFITNLNPRVNTKINRVQHLIYIVEHYGGKALRDITKEELHSYLQSHRRSLDDDPEERWISTYNGKAATFQLFYKWLYYPDMKASERPKPDFISNLVFYRRAEATSVKAEHLWTLEEDAVFLKYCPNPLVSLYHTHSIDTSGRPHELINKRIGDFQIKEFEGKVYAEQEIGRAGKTKGRTVPLISCIPYYKALLKIHPEGQNLNAFVYRSLSPKVAYRNKPISLSTLRGMYAKTKKYFKKLLDDPAMPSNDKRVIESMLAKPWNLYLRRHISLTEKARLVNEYTLRLHAGWTKTSKMVNIYTHELGGESSKAFLEAYGVMPKNQSRDKGVVMPKECPECREPNKPDALYCVKCNFAISIKATAQKEERYVAMEKRLDMLEEQQQGGKQLTENLKNREKGKPAKNIT